MLQDQSGDLKPQRVPVPLEPPEKKRHQNADQRQERNEQYRQRSKISPWQHSDSIEGEVSSERTGSILTKILFEL